MILEVIAFNAEEAMTAEAAGATQIEFVNDLKEDGLTPSLDIIGEMMNSVSIPVHMMVRPKNTMYHDEDDMTKILEAIKVAKEEGVTGIVYGSLNKDGTINEDQLKRVIEAKGNMRLIFHRAIDFSRDYFEAAKTLNKYDIYCVLTSGKESTAIEGFENIKKLKEITNYKILQGAGINISNAKKLIDKTGIENIHIGTAARFDGTGKTVVWASRISAIKDTL